MKIVPQNLVLLDYKLSMVCTHSRQNSNNSSDLPHAGPSQIGLPIPNLILQSRSVRSNEPPASPCPTHLRIPGTATAPTGAVPSIPLPSRRKNARRAALTGLDSTIRYLRGKIDIIQPTITMAPPSTSGTEARSCFLLPFFSTTFSLFDTQLSQAGLGFH